MKTYNRLKQKEKEEETASEGNERKDWDDKLDLMKHMSLVHSRIQKDITADMVLCKLSDKDKEFVIEMTTNAYFIKVMMEAPLRRHIPGLPLTPEEEKGIMECAEGAFDAIYNKCSMVAILNRNTKDNYLVRLMSGVPETELEEKKVDEQEEQKSFLNKLADKLKGKKGEESA